MKKETKIYAGFPATGKSVLFNLFDGNKDLIILDSDSSKFDKCDFPRNYIEHIKSKIGLVDVIFVSTHDVVREAMVNENIEFNLVYPKIELEQDYIMRYKERGNNEKFIELVCVNWDSWINELKSFKFDGVNHIELGEGEYLGDKIDSEIMGKMYNITMLKQINIEKKLYQLLYKRKMEHIELLKTFDGKGSLGVHTRNEIKKLDTVFNWLVDNEINLFNILTNFNIVGSDIDDMICFSRLTSPLDIWSNKTEWIIHNIILDGDE